MSAAPPNPAGEPGTIQKIRDWRFPVKFRMPERDDLIAYALATLAMGLVLGIVIGPGLGNAGKLIPLITPPISGVPPLVSEDDGTSTPTALPPLDSPASSVSPSSTNVSGSSSSDPAGVSTTVTTDVPVDSSTSDTPAPDTPVQEPANDIDPDPSVPIDEEPPAEEGVSLKGTVVGVDSNGRRFSVADQSGNVLVLFGQDPPVAADRVETLILPLANGTFAESGERKVSGIKPKSKLRGTVSWLDPVGGLAVVSNRGSSLAVDLANLPAEQVSALAVGSLVEGTVAFADPVDPAETADPSGTAEPAGTVEATAEEPILPGLIADSLETSGDPTEWIEMSGKLEAIDEAGRVLVLEADSQGLIPATVMIMTPKKFPFESVVEGRTYDVSASLGDDGMLTLTGLSPGYSKSSADDAEAAFGDHG